MRDVRTSRRVQILLDKRKRNWRSSQSFSGNDDILDINVTQLHFDERFALSQAHCAETCLAGEKAAEIVSDLRIDV